MARWIPITRKEFDGSTASIKALAGKRVRNRAALMGALVYEAIDPKKAQEKFDLKAGTTGIVANPHPNQQSLLVAVPTDANAIVTTLGALTKGGFKVLVVNEPTFRMQFELEA